MANSRCQQTPPDVIPYSAGEVQHPPSGVQYAGAKGLTADAMYRVPTAPGDGRTSLRGVPARDVHCDLRDVPACNDVRAAPGDMPASNDVHGDQWQPRCELQSRMHVLRECLFRDCQATAPNHSTSDN